MQKRRFATASAIERRAKAQYNVSVLHGKGACGMPELWDAYLPDGRLAGRTVARGGQMPEGLYHLVADVLVKHKNGEYLVMQRDTRYDDLFTEVAAGLTRSVAAAEAAGVARNRNS